MLTAGSLSLRKKGKRKSRQMTRMTPCNQDHHHQHHKLDHHYQHCPYSNQFIILLSFVRDRPTEKAGRKRPAPSAPRCFDQHFYYQILSSLYPNGIGALFPRRRSRGMKIKQQAWQGLICITIGLHALTPKPGKRMPQRARAKSAPRERWEGRRDPSSLWATR